MPTKLTACLLLVVAFGAGVGLRSVAARVRSGKAPPQSAPDSSVNSHRKFACRWAFWTLSGWAVVIILPVLFDTTYTFELLGHRMLMGTLMASCILIGFLWAMRLGEVSRRTKRK